MDVDIHITGKQAEAIDAGRAQILAVAIFHIEENKMMLLFPDCVDKEEAAAILRKFGCLPRVTHNMEDEGA